MVDIRIWGAKPINIEFKAPIFSIFNEGPRLLDKIDPNFITNSLHCLRRSNRILPLTESSLREKFESIKDDLEKLALEHGGLTTDMVGTGIKLLKERSGDLDVSSRMGFAIDERASSVGINYPIIKEQLDSLRLALLYCDETFTIKNIEDIKQGLNTLIILAEKTSEDFDNKKSLEIHRINCENLADYILNTLKFMINCAKEQKYIN